MFDPTKKMTLPAVLYEVCLTYPDREAIIWTPTGERWQYRHLGGEVARVARGLAALGVGPGETVAIWGANSPQWLMAQWALAHLGAVWVPLDPALEPQAAGYILANSQAEAVVMADDLWDKFQAIPEDQRPDLAVAWPAGGQAPDAWTWDELLDQAKEVSPGEMATMVGAVKDLDVTAIIYTSGTTGRPKGVRLNHKSLVARTQAATERLGIGPQDRLALFCPLHHMFGNTCIALAGLCRGAALVMPGPDFEPGQALAAMAAESCTAVFGTPPMLTALMDHPSRPGLDLSSLRTGIVGGARCPLEFMRRLGDELGATEIAIGYGQTEAASWASLSHPHDPLELRAATVGTPLFRDQVRVADPVTGQALPPGQEGEILVREFIMTGYHQAPELTARVVDKKGWLHTGDRGSLDDKGYLRVSGRLDEVIQRQGREIVPSVIEEELHALGAVAEAHVFGLPPREGQPGETLVLAWLKLKPGSQLTPQEAMDHLAAHLEPGLMPDEIEIKDSLPTTASGKVSKKKLQELARAQRQA